MTQGLLLGVETGNTSQTLSFSESFHVKALADSADPVSPLLVTLARLREGDLVMVDHAIAQLVHRHSALRTSYVCDRELRNCARVVHYHQDGVASARVGARILNPSDLWRVKVVPTGRAWYSVQLEIGHIISDYSSLDIIRRDFELAIAAAAGHGSELSPVVGHEVFADREVAYFRDRQRTLQELSFWTSYLAQSPEVATFPVPTAHSRPQGEVGRRLTYRLPPELSVWVSRAPATMHVTPSAILYGALAVAYSRVFDTPGLTCLTAVANRTDVDLRQTVGFLANQVLFGVEVNAGDSATEAINAAHTSLQRILQHQRLSYPALRAAELLLDELFSVEPRPECLVMAQYLHTDVTPHERPASARRPSIVDAAIPRIMPFNVIFRRRRTGIELVLTWQHYLAEADMIKLLHNIVGSLSDVAGLNRPL